MENPKQKELMSCSSTWKISKGGVQRFQWIDIRECLLLRRRKLMTASEHPVCLLFIANVKPGVMLQNSLKLIMIIPALCQCAINGLIIVCVFDRNHSCL